MMQHDTNSCCEHEQQLAACKICEEAQIGPHTGIGAGQQIPNSIVRHLPALKPTQGFLLTLAHSWFIRNLV
jgi:hypothetical protein